MLKSQPGIQHEAEVNATNGEKMLIKLAQEIDAWRTRKPTDEIS